MFLSITDIAMMIIKIAMIMIRFEEVLMDDVPPLPPLIAGS